MASSTFFGTLQSLPRPNVCFPRVPDVISITRLSFPCIAVKRCTLLNKAEMFAFGLMYSISLRYSSRCRRPLRSPLATTPPPFDMAGILPATAAATGATIGLHCTLAGDKVPSAQTNKNKHKSVTQFQMIVNIELTHLYRYIIC